RRAWIRYEPADKDIPVVSGRSTELGDGFTPGSVNRPETGADQLGEVAVRVAEVDAPGPTGPAHDALDGHALRFEVSLPWLDVLGGNREGEMVPPRAAAVGRDDAASARDGKGLGRPALGEQQQDAAPGHVQGDQPLALQECGEAEEAAVELRRPLHI